MRQPLPLLAFSGLLALAAPAPAGVTTVNGDFFALQAAVDAAADGDVILIKPGTDGGFFGTVVIDGKSLTLVVDGGTYVLRELIVRNVAAAQQVTVRGMTLGPTSFTPANGPDAGALTVRDCDGSVWVDACTFTPPQQSNGAFGFSPDAVHGLSVLNSDDVVVSDCTLTGGKGANEFGSCTIPGYAPSSRGGDGVYARDSRVALLRSTATGGVGGGAGGGGCPQGSKSAGGHGLRASGSSVLHVAGCTLTGADNPGSALQPGSGLVVEGAAAAVALRGAVVAAGAGAPAQPAQIAPPGTVTSYAAAPRGLTVSSPLRIGQAGNIVIDGVAGETVALFQALQGAWTALPAKQGVFLLAPPVGNPALQATNPIGTWTIPFNTPPLVPAGMQGLTVLLQLMVKSGGQVTIEDVASCTVLEANIP